MTFFFNMQIFIEKNNLIMQKASFTDNDVMVKWSEHLNYENNELGINPRYTHCYCMTTEEASGQPASPLLNW